MSSRTKATLCTVAISGAALGAFAATGWSDDPPAGADGGHFRIVEPAMEVTGPALARAGAGAGAGKPKPKPKKPKKPKVTNLITTDPVTIAANDEIVAELNCKKSQGIPLDGGAISPPSPAQVAISVISRFNPNPPFNAPKQSFFVGVRNLDPVNPAEFRATLVCAKGIDQ